MTELEKLTEHINQIETDFVNIKDAILEAGVPVPEGTRTLSYGSLVKDVHEAGKKSERDAYWDSYLNYGNRTNYTHSFSRGSCNEVNFKPNHDIRPIDAEYMFSYNSPSYEYCTSPTIPDLERYLADIGVKLDFSRCTNIYRAFYVSQSFTALPEIDATCTTNLRGLFYGCLGLKRIAKLKIQDNGATDFGADASWERTFWNCTALEDITIEGIIGNTVSFEWCPLSKASIESVINALSPDSTLQTVTFSYDAVLYAMSLDVFDELIADKTNWTIELG
jgi:hypothetical protein